MEVYKVTKEPLTPEGEQEDPKPLKGRKKENP
jgi:hypothetical protein